MSENNWDFWKRRLAGEVLAIDANEPQTGFYRERRGETWVTVAYWYENGTLRCQIDSKDVGEDRAIERWPYASKHPIPFGWFETVRKGGPWPDLHEAVTADRRNSNNAPDDNSFEGLQDRIGDLARDAEKLIAAGAAKSQEEADRAADLANRLGALWTQADKQRAAEKKPHDDEAKKVQEKWRPVLSLAAIYTRVKEVVHTPFLIEQDRKRKEAQAQAQREAEEAAKAGREPPPPPPAATKPVKAGAGGRRSIALRTQKDVVIEDRAAVLAYFAEGELMTAFLQASAERAVRAGVTVPGTKVIERQVAA